MRIHQALDRDTADVLRRQAIPVAAGSLAAVAVTALRLGPGARLAAYCVFAVLAVVLTAVDLALLRLPDALVLPGTVVTVALLALPGDGHAWLRGAEAAAALTGAHLVVALALGGALGLGDVKVSVVIGFVLGALGWPALVAGVTYAYLGIGLLAVLLLAVRKAGRRTRLPFGPFLLGGAWLAVLVWA